MTIEDGGSRWVMTGEIDFSVTHRVKRALAATIDGFPKTVDLSRVTFMDSSGLHLLLMKVTAASRPRLVNAPQQVHDLLEMSGATSMVDHVTRPVPDPPGTGRSAHPADGGRAS
ncbi:STAS domain-containing protein [Cellulosimicrobium marinum]|uniref:STAS domain-containing protein n=1 Tax=Cellulosimicrobium marinum TaxID=1638992 RepID=UPI001E4C73B1|nr:STAS domain-containing protein [Cellulosimicrobium marinum]MCB7135217.1 STAS domain-containing protein [Cellulosimicrobium marinum]